jgi:1,2-dihydroxy-3-keto-5-methylthiopentene dioxygenase
MTLLSTYDDSGILLEGPIREFDHIVARLAEVGIRVERWDTAGLSGDAGQDEVLGVYADAVERLNAQYGFRAVDVVSLRPDNLQAAELRQKFLAEHTHDDFEVRFFVDGKGLFYLHVDGKVYLILCESGDLISVPAGTTHWFDMGAHPDFMCIRFFTTPEGWVGHFTGSDIATRFPDFDTFVAAS